MIKVSSIFILRFMEINFFKFNVYISLMISFLSLKPEPNKIVGRHIARSNFLEKN